VKKSEVSRFQGFKVEGHRRESQNPRFWQRQPEVGHPAVGEGDGGFKVSGFRGGRTSMRESKSPLLAKAARSGAPGLWGCGNVHSSHLLSREVSYDFGFCRRGSQKSPPCRRKSAMTRTGHPTVPRALLNDSGGGGPTREEDAGRGAGASDALRGRPLLRCEVPE